MTHCISGYLILIFKIRKIIPLILFKWIYSLSKRFQGIIISSNFGNDDYNFFSFIVTFITYSVVSTATFLKSC